MWKRLSVSNKLYVVVGLMTFLIAAELLTLLFAMEVLSSVRAFVHGEGLWSKAQKDAVYSLHRYSVTFDHKYYDQYLVHLQIPLGDRRARLELIKENPNLQEVKEGFIQGEIHEGDIPGLIHLIQRFGMVSYISRAIEIWTRADLQIDDLIAAAEKLRSLIEDRALTRDYPKIERTIKNLEQLNLQLTVLENDFSFTLGEGSRWLEQLLRYLLVLAVLTIESTGLFLTFTFARNLTRSLEELTQVASEVGKGNFTKEVPVRSSDELGQLAIALNQMTQNLKKNIGERKRAESASKLKSLFLANMSHEIRTPLGVILGLTEILKDPNIPVTEFNKYLGIIEKTGNNLKRIINDILDISKVEAGHLEIDKATFNLSDFMKDLRAMLSVKAEQNRNHLVFIEKGDVPVEVFTDKLRLRQILVNIIDNASKFTDSGKITIEYGINGIKLFFRITDTGIGIPPEHIADLFKPFSQGDPSSTRKYEGTGLGLILSKRLATAMGGDVVLESSNPGAGSTFLITIAHESNVPKRSPVSLSSIEHFDIRAIRGKNILLVEDSEDNQLLIRVLLSRCNMNVQFAKNGEEGVARAKSGKFDLILMDVQMPVMDGYTATLLLRQGGFKGPIIALTAHAMKEDRDRCIRAGCNDYLTKPIEIKALYEALYRNLVDESTLAAA
jgi:two-component system, sensor histidine kinase